MKIKKESYHLYKYLINLFEQMTSQSIEACTFENNQFDDLISEYDIVNLEDELSKLKI